MSDSDQTRSRFGTICLGVAGIVLLLLGLWLVHEPETTPRTTAATPGTASAGDAVKGSVVLKSDSVGDDDNPYTAHVAVEADGRVMLWKRRNGACYLSIDVVGWQTVYVDASGPLCDHAPVNAVTIESSR